MNSYFAAVVRFLFHFLSYSENQLNQVSNEKNKAAQHGLKTHLFLNVPPEERAPGSLGNPGQLKDHINLFNSVLASHIIRFAESYPGQPTDLTIIAV